MKIMSVKKLLQMVVTQLPNEANFPTSQIHIWALADVQLPFSS
jgi:hypothetical protein